MPLAGSGHPGGPYFTVDLHLHTTRGSSDSNISPRALVERAREIRIGAVCVTEHDNMWDSAAVEALATDSGVVVLHGMEVTTDLGHVGVFGLDRYVGGIYKLKELRRVADIEGGILIANHPFRYKLDAKVAFMNGHGEPLDPGRPERAAELEIFRMTDAIEVLNGACSEEENLFALRVARHLGLAEVAGSDSHWSRSVGCVTTLFSRPVRDERDLIELIKARQCRAGRGLLTQDVRAFDAAQDLTGQD
jgi:predicted metal-dependent phosphoesterase TrpH